MIAKETLDDLNLDISIDGAQVIVHVYKDNTQIGYVVFDRDGKTLHPQDLSIDEKYHRRGFASKIYDLIKSKGFTIHRSSDQTQAGKNFWDKHRPAQEVWEQELAEWKRIAGIIETTETTTVAQQQYKIGTPEWFNRPVNDGQFPTGFRGRVKKR